MNGGVETGRWYDVRIELDGPRIRCYLDGKLVHDVEEGVTQTLFASAGRCASGDLVLKVVNYGEEARAAEIGIRGAGRLSAEGKAIVLAGNPADENTLENPGKVSPQERKASGLGAGFGYTFEPWSLTILRIPAGN